MHKIKSISSNLIINLIVIALMCNYVLSTPMLYKRNPDDNYERDLVAVSSTVIPLTVLEVSYGIGGKPSEEYKEAYLKRLRKKVLHKQGEADIDEEPDTLITIKKKQSDASGKAKVQGIIRAPKLAENN